MSFDPLDPRHFQQRARSVFEKAARMQALHGQAQAQVHARRPVPPAPVPSAEQPVAAPASLLEHSAQRELATAHHTLQEAAQLAAELAAVDAEVARLNDHIHGTSPHSPGHPPMVRRVDEMNVLDLPHLVGGNPVGPAEGPPEEPLLRLPSA